MKKNLKNKEGHKETFITEDLTHLRARLLTYVKGLSIVDKVWTVNGKIAALLKTVPGRSTSNQTRKPIYLTSPDDLFKLGLRGVDYEKLGISGYLHM